MQVGREGPGEGPGARPGIYFLDQKSMAQDVAARKERED